MKYREKIMKEKMSTESGYLSQKLYEIENADWKTKKEWHINNIKRWALNDNIYAEKSEDCLCWYLWKSVPDQVRSYLKMVPAVFLSSDIIESILEAQPWMFI